MASIRSIISVWTTQRTITLRSYSLYIIQVLQTQRNTQLINIKKQKPTTNKELSL